MKYICIHGHFYQPPRENAWTDHVDRQDSAAPYHDWNARISAECYSPNSHSRVLNGKKELVSLNNNYSQISFNFGPTLLSWMEKHDKNAYAAILEADKISVKNFGGHGSALAQVYNHLIMPLADRADKETQVVWGIKDFEYRFKRKPEGMWLSEAAVDTETLEIMAEHGVKFTILAPGSCSAVRKINAKTWTEAKNASVDPKRPYLYNLPSGKSIVLFFYDGPLSQGIAFGDTLSSGENFAGKLMQGFTDSKEDQFLHIATDGETYGHHHKFGDMALAYCLKYIEEAGLAKISVYGQYLETHPPKYEAKIYDNTSWSCFHGVERWRSDCGCNSGGHQGWNQKWRGPLRDALDYARGEMRKTFETLGKEYFKDPYAARNAYIDVFLAGAENAADKFLADYGTDAAARNKTAALKFMEMQRYAMFMYTSCGWFFDEISGIETVQVMQYAACALDINKDLSGADAEPRFIKLLESAPSNIAGFQNGKNIYEHLVAPSRFDFDRAAFYYATLLKYEAASDRLFVFKITDVSTAAYSKDGHSALGGSAVFTHKDTLEPRKKYFLLTFAADYQPVCFVGDALPFPDEEFKKLIEEKGPGAALELQKYLPARFTLEQLFSETQALVLRGAVRGIEEATYSEFEKIFNSEYPVLRELKFISRYLPQEFLAVARYVFNNDIKKELSKDAPDAQKTEEIIEEAGVLGITLDGEGLSSFMTETLQSYAEAFRKEPSLSGAQKLRVFLESTEFLPFKPDTAGTQEAVFAGIAGLSAADKKNEAVQYLAQKLLIAIPK